MEQTREGWARGGTAGGPWEGVCEVTFERGTQELLWLLRRGGRDAESPAHGRGIGTREAPRKA